MVKKTKQLGEILIEKGIITPHQLKEALEEQKAASGRFLGAILVSRGVASEEQVALALSEQLGFVYVDVRDVDIEPRVIELVPEEVCRRLAVLPLFITQGMLTVAMDNPLDVKAIDELQLLTNFRIKPVFGCPSAIYDVIEREYGFSSGKRKVEEKVEISRPKAKVSDKLSRLMREASLGHVVEMVNYIITHAVEMGASDIHLEPEGKKFNCRYRIDGVLYSMPQVPKEYEAAVISRIKIMANMDIAEKRLPQDGRIRFRAGDKDVDLRISTFPTIYGENVVVRILDRSKALLELEELGFSKEEHKKFEELIRRPHGIILVTGPTGSGKTTTLYAALNRINTPEKNIITLEDPVEYEIPHIRQSQVNIKAGLTFASGLRSIVRQDPDVIMIGEIRDKETADIAIHAALTGHLVFSTLHTNDAPSAAARLIDMRVEPFLVASAVIGVLAQRLVRTLSESCKKQYKSSEELKEKLGFKNNRDYLFYKEVGCQKCRETGYQGRTGVFELLIPNDEIKKLITKKVSADTIRDAAVKAGMKTLRDDALEKVIAGVTSVSELLRVTEEV